MFTKIGTVLKFKIELKFFELESLRKFVKHPILSMPANPEEGKEEEETSYSF